MVCSPLSDLLSHGVFYHRWGNVLALCIVLFGPTVLFSILREAGAHIYVKST